jgi:hypothetical protein
LVEETRENQRPATSHSAFLYTIKMSVFLYVYSILSRYIKIHVKCNQNIVSNIRLCFT